MKLGTLARIALLFVALPAVGVGSASAQSLTLAQARTAMDAAEAEARRNQWNLTILIVDADGVPIYLRRMDGASPRTQDVAMRKVMTSLASGMHSGDYGQALAAGRTDTIPNGVTFEGGLLVRLGGQIVGAMSASGARGSEDAQVVRVGMVAIGAQP